MSSHHVCWRIVINILSIHCTTSSTCYYNRVLYHPRGKKSLFKYDDKNNTDNHRPISVLPALSKLLEKAVHNQLSQYLEENNLLNIFQFGYREKRSTQLATTLLVDEIREAAEKSQLIGTLFLDLSKAFDTINHDVILEKLKR